MTLTVGSLFSGIGGFDLGLERAGFTPVFQCDNDPFCNKVLAKHWPGVKRYDDVRNVQAERLHESNVGADRRHNVASARGELPGHAGSRQPAITPAAGVELAGRVDLICGGFPCQDLSVAGKRAGLDGARSGLWFEFHRILSELRPTFCLIENVPGLLSSNGGADFAVILWGLEQLGYVVGWAVLDSQHFGVPQRRRRVYIIGGPSRASVQQILSLCESGDWNTQARRAEREDVAATIRGRSSSPGVNEPGRGGEDDSNLVTVARSLRAQPNASHRADSDTYVPVLSPTLSRRDAKGPSSSVDQAAIIVAHSLRAEGFDASEDGAGRGTPLVADTYTATRYNEGDASTQETHTGTLLSELRKAVGEKAFTEWGLGVFDSLQPSPVLRPRVHEGWLSSEAEHGDLLGRNAPSGPQSSRTGAMLRLWQAVRVGCPPPGWQPSEQLAGELNAHLSQLSQPGASPAAFLLSLWQASEGLRLLRQALSAVQEVWESAADEAQPAQPRGGVRRLTPIETERLQGFPDSWTCICGANENLAACRCPDGPRYKACGNAVSVPVIEYLGHRIREVLA